MRHEVKILKLSDGWYFQIISMEGSGWETKIIRNVVIQHNTLEEALNTARTLKLHIQNVDSLPLTQYKTAA